MDGRIYSPEKGKFISLKTKHGQKVLENYNEHRIGGDKHKNCAYCKIVNPQTGKLVSTYGQTGGRVITSYNMMGGLEEESPKYKKDNPNNLLKEYLALVPFQVDLPVMFLGLNLLHTPDFHHISSLVFSRLKVLALDLHCLLGFHAQGLPQHDPPIVFESSVAFFSY